MKLSTRRDIDAPPEKVFAHLTDFDRFETAARDRGAEVTREAGGPDAPAGASWTVAFDYRGRRRRGDLRVVTYDPNQQIALKAQIDGLGALGNVEIEPLGGDRSRVYVSVDLKPGSMTARLLVQSLKLAKSSLSRRLDRRVEQFARRVEHA